MNWKAYDEVHFSDQYILRWVREGDEYVNRITKEMMEDFKAVVSQQQAEIEALKSLSLRRENLGYFYDLHARQQAEIEALKSELTILKTWCGQTKPYQYQKGMENK